MINTIKGILEIIENELASNANIKTKKTIEKYMRNIQEYRGLKNTEIQPIFKKLWTYKIKDLTVKDQKSLALSLLKKSYGEDMYFGMLLYGKLIDHITLNDVKDVEKIIIDGKIKGWANIDSLSGRLYRGWAKGNQENCKYISEYSKSDNIWLQRLSCVTFVTLAKHGDNTPPNFIGFYNLLESICQTTIRNNERFVQLGTGWLLREMGLADKTRMMKFIEQNIEYFTREGLSYAVEKLSADEKKKMMSLINKPKVDQIDGAAPKKKKKNSEKQ